MTPHNLKGTPHSSDLHSVAFVSTQLLGAGSFKKRVQVLDTYDRSLSNLHSMELSLIDQDIDGRPGDPQSRRRLLDPTGQLIDGWSRSRCFFFRVPLWKGFPFLCHVSNFFDVDHHRDPIFHDSSACPRQRGPKHVADPSAGTNSGVLTTESFIGVSQV